MIWLLFFEWIGGSVRMNDNDRIDIIETVLLNHSSKDLVKLFLILIKGGNMEYKYTVDDNFEDYASGRVLYHTGGAATFPVRLSLEIFERCRSYSEKKQDIILYDCCCGGAYMLTVLGFLKGESLSAVYGSDIDEQIIKAANDNLHLLTREGLYKRKEQIETLYKLYEKQSHKDALRSIEKMLQTGITKEIKTKAFLKDILSFDKISLQSGLSVQPDIIITDVPYGNLTEWKGSQFSEDPFLDQLMKRLYDICNEKTIVCICSDKKQKIVTNGFIRLEKQGIGKRKFEIYKKQVIAGGKFNA